MVLNLGVQTHKGVVTGVLETLSSSDGKYLLNSFMHVLCLLLNMERSDFYLTLKHFCKLIFAVFENQVQMQSNLTLIVAAF